MIVTALKCQTVLTHDPPGRVRCHHLPPSTSPPRGLTQSQLPPAHCMVPKPRQASVGMRRFFPALNRARDQICSSVYVAMVAVQVTGLQITWTSTADSRAARRRHIVRSCRGAPCRRLPTARPGASKADPKEGLLGLQRSSTSFLSSKTC